MMKPHLLILAAFSVTVTTIAAESSQRIRERDPKWRAPEAAAVRQNPLTRRSDIVSGGRKVFEERCAICHGGDAGGTDRGPDLLSPGVQAQTDGELFWKISSGNTRGGMPTFSFLPEPQRWQLVLYLRSLNNGGTSERVP